MTQISQLRPGQKVEFYRSHDKQHKLSGTVVAVQKNGNAVRIKTDAANGSISRLEEAHCDDVFFVGSGSGAAPGVVAEWDEGRFAKPAADDSAADTGKKS